MDIGCKLKVMRRDRGVSQDQLSSMSGVSRITISNYERGVSVPSLDSLLRVCDALGVELFGGRMDGVNSRLSALCDIGDRMRDSTLDLYCGIGNVLLIHGSEGRNLDVVEKSVAVFADRLENIVEDG